MKDRIFSPPMSEPGLASRTVITVTATSRPKRVAFLVNPAQVTPNDIDVITHFAIHNWGGGYYPIIPTNGVDIDVDYWGLLRSSDPDVVYPIMKLDDTLQWRIEFEIGPAAIQEYDSNRTERPFLVDTRYTSGLNVLDIPRFLSTSQRGVLPFKFLYFTTKNRAGSTYDFVTRNFGRLDDVISNKRAFEQLPVHEVDIDSTEVAALLESWATEYQHELVTPRDLSVSLMSPPFRVRNDSSGGAFHLIVGDSIHDLLYVWNRQQLSSRWKGHEFLWLPTSAILDQTLLTAVGKWIGRVYWDNTQKLGVVVSYSQDETRLESVAKVMRESAFMPFAVRKMQESTFPSSAFEPQWFGPFDDSPPATKQGISLHNDSGLVAVPMPRFLTHRHATSGGWMVDMDIEYHLDPARYGNKSDLWRLPQNARLGRAFVESQGLARITSSGMPSAEIAPRDQHLRVKIPSKRVVVMHLIQSVTNAKTHRACGTSIEGEKLSGIVQLLGSLGSAARLFDDPYTREVMLGLAGPSEGHARSQMTRVQNLLTKFSNTGASLEDESKRTELAKRIVDQVAYFSEPTPSLSWNDFKSRFADIKASDAGKQALSGETFDEYRIQQLQALVEDQILIQGVLLDCPHCGTKNWRRVDDASGEITCDGCLLTFPFSPTATWLFRLNELMSNGINKTGVLAVLNALKHLEGLASNFFLYIPCQDIYEEIGDGKSEKVTDFDIVCIRDGRFIIGEVKSSPDGFLDFDFAKLGRLARDIRPARVVLAATGKAWPQQLSEPSTQLETELSAVQVELERLLLDW